MKPPPLPDLAGQRVLVTGAGGFLGGVLCRRLVEAGAEVHGVMRTRPVPAGALPHRAELSEPNDVARCFAAARPALVFHLAAPVDLSRDPAAFLRLRAGILDATHHVAHACLHHGARLVAAGTCEEYGAAEAPFSEDTPAKPVSAYSALKLAATVWLLTLHRTAGLPVTVVRPFLTFGPGQAPARLVPAAIAAALAGRPLPMTDGRQTRELNHVDDMVEALLAASAPAAVGQLLNLGGGPEIAIRDLAALIFRLAGADPGSIELGALPRRAGEVTRFCGDHTRARALLGIAPRVSLEEGLRRTIAHARGHDAR
ncbi:MAG: NAD(P)-dependent oxidoreductase [Pseudomonadota bacterium]